MPPAAQSTDGKTAKKRGPSPNRILLKSLRTAIQVGVASTMLDSLIGVAQQAVSVEQAPVYRMIARLLDKESEKILPGVIAERDGSDEPDDEEEVEEEDNGPDA